MEKLSALIVDDEPLARQRLRGMLLREPAVEIVGECASGPEAVAAIKAAPPDLVFLDMQMPGCDGLQVLAQLPETHRPAVIFATAHERFAVDAFNLEAVDYLLKPYDRERLQQALRRAQAFLLNRPGTAATLRSTNTAVAVPANSGSERIAFKVDRRFVFVSPKEIFRVEANDNYVLLHLTTGRLLLRETMAAIEARLGSVVFMRINRSAIVNREQIREIQPAQHGDYQVVLRDGTLLPLSRSLRGQLESFVPKS